MILTRIPESRFSEVTPQWKGQTAVILGGGPSLTIEQVELVRDAAVRCIAVNDTYLLAPWADVQYAADIRWHKWQEQGVPKTSLGLSGEEVRDRWSRFQGQKCSIENFSGIHADEIHVLKNAHGTNHGFGLSMDFRKLVTGRNSGFQALNLAVLAGAQRILLLGFDGQPASDGKGHWFGEHPMPTPPAAYQQYRQAMSAAENLLIEVGVDVFNCSPGSAIDSFPKLTLSEVL